MRVEISPELLVQMFRDGNEIHARVDKGIPEGAILDGVCVNRNGNVVLIFVDFLDCIDVEISRIEKPI